jgi:hypothetical protein
VDLLARAVCFSTHDDKLLESQEDFAWLELSRPSDDCRQAALLLAAEMLKSDSLKQVSLRSAPAAARVDS